MQEWLILIILGVVVSVVILIPVLAFKSLITFLKITTKQEVTKLDALGWSTKEISNHLRISEDAVEFYKKGDKGEMI